jgi:hypothetical protein
MSIYYQVVPFHFTRCTLHFLHMLFSPHFLIQFLMSLQDVIMDLTFQICKIQSLKQLS